MKINQKKMGILLAVVIVMGAGWFWLSAQYVTPVLMYHHIGPNSDHRVDTVTLEHFSGQMKYLAEHGYRVVPIETYVEAVKQGRQLPRKNIVLTFDDGHADNYQYAFPVLKQYGFSWMLFLPTDFIGAEKHVSEEQVKEMMAAGLSIGGHTMSHTYLPDLKDLVQLTKEIVDSKKILEDHFQTTIDIFSYPIGGFNDAIKAEVQAAGFIAAFTTNRGSFRNKDVWALTRIKVTDRDRGIIFAAKLSGFYNIVRKPKAHDAFIRKDSSSFSLD